MDRDGSRDAHPEDEACEKLDLHGWSHSWLPKCTLVKFEEEISLVCYRAGEVFSSSSILHNISELGWGGGAPNYSRTSYHFLVHYHDP